jgi:hypothetical protein
MRRITLALLPGRRKLAAAALALVAAAGIGAGGISAASAATTGPAAVAAPAALAGVTAPALPDVAASITGYHYQSGWGCGDGPGCAAAAFVNLHTTNDNNHVWINGSVGRQQSGGVTITWYGVGGGNGTQHLSVGANFTYAGHSYYFRDAINSVNGSQWCDTTGNAPWHTPGACYQ